MNSTHAPALALLTQWIIANNLEDRHVIDCGDSMRGYLARIGFDDALKSNHRPISPDLIDWAVGLTRIDNQMSTDAVTSEIVDIIDVFVQPEADDRRALVILIAEMVENIHRHASIPCDGNAVAQVYPKRLKMGFAFIDAGMGIRSSF